MKKIWLSSFLLLVILASSIYFMMPENVKIEIGNTNTKYSVWENDSWVHSATEYVHLYDGSTKMRASKRDIRYETMGNITTAYRASMWKDNISTLDTYVFDSTVEDVELVPIEHSFTCINCEGKIVHFEYRDIEYDGITRWANSPESFGHRMKVEWREDYYTYEDYINENGTISQRIINNDFMWAKVYQQSSISDKLIIRYRPDSSTETYSVRMFDPVTPPTGGRAYYNFSSVTDLWGSDDLVNSGGATNSNTYPSFATSGNSSPNSSDFTFVEASASDYYNCTSCGLNGANDFSINVWLNPDTLVTTDAAGIFFNDGDTGNKLQFAITTTDGTPKRLKYYDGTGYYSTGLVGLYAWNMVTLTRDGTNLSFYINGTYDSSSVVASTALPSSGFTIGRYFALANRYGYDGQMDELSTYNITLTNTQISNLYNYGDITGASTSNPVMVTSKIYPTSVVSSSTKINLSGECNATDADGGNLTYYYKWWKNDALDSSGYNSTSVAESVAVNVSKLEITPVTDDEYILGCLAYDGTDNSSWLNSSKLTITATLTATLHANINLTNWNYTLTNVTWWTFDTSTNGHYKYSFTESGAEPNNQSDLGYSYTLVNNDPVNNHTAQIKNDVTSMSSSYDLFFSLSDNYTSATEFNTTYVSFNLENGSTNYLSLFLDVDNQSIEWYTNSSEAYNITGGLNISISII